MDKIEGRINGRYDIKRLISSDSSGKLIEAYDSQNSRYVRLRILSELSRETMEEISRNFLLYSRLRHRNLLSNYRFDILDNFNQEVSDFKYFFTAESINDEELLSYTSLKKKDRLYVLESVIRALCYLHFMGITYGRLSFSNCFIYRDKSGELNVKLADIASVTCLPKAGSKDFSHSKFFVGGREADRLTTKSDVYSLGYFIFYLVSGLDYRQVSMDYAQLQLVDEKIADLIINATHSDPDKRISDVLTLWRRLAELIDISTDFSDRNFYEKIDFGASFVAHEDKVESIENKVLASTAEGKKNVIFINSRAGKGKSRFLYEINHRLRIAALQPYMAELPRFRPKADDKYPTFRRLLHLILSKNRLNPSLIERLGPDLFHLAPEYAEKYGVELSLNEEGFLEQKIIARFLLLLQELSLKKSVVIIIDNVDLMEREELALLSAIMRADFERNPTLILSINDMPHALQHWGLSDETEIIELEPFNYHDTVNYLKKALHMPEGVKRLARAITGICHGNPRVIEKTIKQLFAFGKIKMTEEREWSVDNYDFYFTDEEANRIGYARVTKLMEEFSEDARHIIKQMAVYSQRLDVFFAIRLSGLSGKNFLSAIKELLDSKIIVKTSSDWGNYYEFRDYRMSTIIYQRIDEEEKIRLHSVAASTYLNDGLVPDGAEFDSFVYHLVRSNQEEKAIEVLEEKASLLKKAHFFNTAIDYYQYIFSLSSIKTKGLQYVDIIKNIARLKYKLGEIEKSEYFYDLAARVCKAEGYTEEEVDVSLKLISIYLVQSRTELAGETLRYLAREKKDYLTGVQELKFLHLNIQLKDLTLGFSAIETLVNKLIKQAIKYKSKKYEAISLIELARLDSRNQKPELSVPKLEKALTLLEDVDAPRQFKEIYRILGKTFLTYIIDTDKAEEYLKKAHHYMRIINIPWESSKVFVEYGRLYQVRGDYDEAIKHYSIAERYALKGGQSEALMITVIKMLEIYLCQSNYEACEQQIQKFDDLFEQCRDYENKEYYYSFMLLKAELYLEFGLFSYVTRLLYKVYHDGFSYLKSTYRFKYELIHTKFQYVNHLLFGADFDAKIIKNLTPKTQRREEAMFYCKILLELAIISRVDEETTVFDEVYKLLINLVNPDMPKAKIDKMRFIKAVVEEDYAAIKRYTEEIDNQSVHYSCALFSVLGDEELRKGNPYFALANYCEAIGQFFEKLLTIPNKYRQLRLNSDFCLNKVYKKIDSILGQEELAGLQGNKLDLVEKLKKLVIRDKNFIRMMRKNYEDKFSLSLFEWKDLIKSLNDDPASNVSKLIYFLTEYTFSQFGEIFILGENGELIEGFCTDGSYVTNARDYVLGLILSKSDYVYIERPSLAKDMDSFVRDGKSSKTILAFPIVLSEYDSSTFCRRCDDALKHKRKVLAYVYLESTRIINNLNINKYKSIMKNEGFMGLIVNDYNSTLKSSTDKLTGLLVRSHVRDRLNKVFERGSEFKKKIVFSVLMIDIDHFKSVNDSFGHRRGDEVLSALGAILKKTLRSTDIIGRYGGEEFIAILLNANKREVYQIAEKLRGVVEKAKILGEDRTLTISIGAASYPDDGKQVDNLIECADKALYYSKNNGRNRVSLYNPGMDRAVLSRDKLAGISALTKADNTKGLRSVLELVNLISQKMEKEDKLNAALGVVLDMIEGREVVVLDKKGGVYSKRVGDDTLHKTSSVSLAQITEILAESEDGSGVNWSKMMDMDIDGVPYDWMSYVYSGLKKDGEELGTMFIWSMISEREYTPSDYSYLSGLAPLIATILEL